MTVGRYSYAAPWLWAHSHGQRRLWCLTYPVTVSGVLQLRYEQGWPQLAQQAGRSRRNHGAVRGCSEPWSLAVCELPATVKG
jgi:hypothetical protein